ncbi:hypothetical protein, partial [Holdemania filiformis]|uniref:hypothetical protein n=2 Tax=Holdemania filiformis TaxID=61171 RepID=UPI002670B0D1
SIFHAIFVTAQGAVMEVNMKNILAGGFLFIGGILLMQIKRINDLFLPMGGLSAVLGFGLLISGLLDDKAN